MQVTLKIGLTILALAVAPMAQAQTTGLQFGPKVGLSLALLDGQINSTSEFKPGLVIGGFVRWRPSERLAIQPELVFSQQGTTSKLSYGGYSAERKINLNYLNIPVLLKLYVGNVFNLQFGPQFGVLLSGRRVGQNGYYSGSNGSGYTTEDVDVSTNYKNDFALCGGLGMDLHNGLLASARINYGLTDINNDSKSVASRQALGIGGTHNRTIEFSVGYAFSGK